MLAAARLVVSITVLNRNQHWLLPNWSRTMLPDLLSGHPGSHTSLLCFTLFTASIPIERRICIQKFFCFFFALHLGHLRWSPYLPSTASSSFSFFRAASCSSADTRVLSVFLSVSLSVCLSVCLCLCLSVCLSLSLCPVVRALPLERGFGKPKTQQTNNHTHTRTHTHTHTYTHTHTNTHTHTHTRARARTHARSHARTHTRTHARKHTRRHKPTNQPTDRPTNQPTKKQTNKPTNNQTSRNLKKKKGKG